MSNLPVFDSHDLKDRIHRLKAQKSLLTAEKLDLQQQIAIQERSLVVARQEYSIKAPDQELRWQAGDEDGVTGDLGSVGEGGADHSIAGKLGYIIVIYCCTSIYIHYICLTSCNKLGCDKSNYESFIV
jgi:hypothetical protein